MRLNCHTAAYHKTEGKNSKKDSNDICISVLTYIYFNILNSF